MLRRATVLVVVVAVAAALRSAPLDLLSPDGSVCVRLTTDADGHLTYSVIKDGRARLEPARAGVIVDGVDLGAEASLGAPQTRRISERFPWRGNKASAVSRCYHSEIPVQAGAAQRPWTLEVRVFDDGAAFRYRVSGAGMRHVAGESTVWQLPRDATVWFQTDTTGYEGVYRSSRADEIPRQEVVDGRTRPVHLGPPVTVEFADGGFGLLTEAGLYHYSGYAFHPAGDAKLQSAFVHDPDGWSHEGPLLSPWRVLVLSPDLDRLVNSDVIPALGEPPDPELFPAGMDTSWIQPGKAPCTWMVFGNDGAQWHRQKAFVDDAAAMGCEYLLVDAGWRTGQWGWLKDGGDVWVRAAELCAYAAQRGVGIFLWHAYPDGREEGPGLTTVEAREEFFANCRKAGVKGVKIDFFDSESKATVEVCEDLLRRAAKHQLMINLHGVYKPTGEMRTWPHEISREGIREQEYVLWGSLPLTHYGALPFTRLAAGHADFLPGYVQRRFLKNTTAVFQMASVVVFSSPFLCWPDSPEAYLESPFLQFVRSVPVTWDETRLLAGSKIGDTVIMARRKGSAWYLAVLNCRPEPRTIEIDLSALQLASDEMTVYRDGERATEARIESGLKLPAGGRLAVTLLSGGGFLAQFQHPPADYGTWK
ncbi:MAG TPA: glycoside hydrolase family 97 catalytic domain-containing protein [Opitutaceae bacterium]